MASSRRAADRGDQRLEPGRDQGDPWRMTTTAAPRILVADDEAPIVRLRTGMAATVDGNTAYVEPA
jgi:hypothetical protein